MFDLMMFGTHPVCVAETHEFFKKMNFKNSCKSWFVSSLSELFCFFCQASLGTTKYCSYFLKNMQCPKPDCMYLHELGDEAASFTKEEMQVGMW